MLILHNERPGMHRTLYISLNIESALCVIELSMWLNSRVGGRFGELTGWLID